MMNTRLFTVTLCVILIIAIGPTVFAADEVDYQIYAETLQAYGLFSGVGTSQDGQIEFDLQRSPTRLETLVMLLRLLGEEDEALKGNWSHPFQDVPEWGDKQVGYAYTKGYTAGISETSFGSSDEATSQQYITFLLRALGYDDNAFSYENALAFSDEVNLTNGSYLLKGDTFKRGDMAWLSLEALRTNLKDEEITLGDKLLEAGIITDSQWVEGNNLWTPLKEDIPEWLTIDELAFSFGRVTMSNGEIIYCFYELTSDGYARVIHEFPMYFVSRIYEQTVDIDGIRMKIEDGRHYFNYEDMLALGIDPFDSTNATFDPKISLSSLNTTVKLSQLYSESAAHIGPDYFRLRGYTGDDVLATYFSGTSSSYRVSVEDMRPNRSITWSYNGRTYTNTRDECYGFFGDTLWFQSNNIPTSVLTVEWFQNTFGDVYTEYLEYLAFTSDAEKMVSEYLKQ